MFLNVDMCFNNLFHFLHWITVLTRKQIDQKKKKGSGHIYTQSQILLWKPLLSTLVGPEYIKSPVFIV